MIMWHVDKFIKILLDMLLHVDWKLVSDEWFLYLYKLVIVYSLDNKYMNLDYASFTIEQKKSLKTTIFIIFIKFSIR